jgi:hypothetical protein
MARIPWNKGMTFEFKPRPQMKGRFVGASNPYYGKQHTPETRAKISLACKGRVAPNKGKHPSDATKEKMHLASTGRIPWNKGKGGYKVSRTVESNKNMSRGPAHYLWVGDRTKLKKQNRRNDSAYKEWRITVYRRDGFKCKISNVECRGRIEAHHILAWAEFPELRYQPNNGITLCRNHHPKKNAEAITKSPYFQGLVGKVK